MPFVNDGKDVLGDVLKDSARQAFNPHAGPGHEPVGRFRTTAERPQPEIQQAPAPVAVEEPPKNYAEQVVQDWRKEFPDLVGSEKYVAAEVNELEAANPTAAPADLMRQAGLNIRAKVNAIFEAGREAERKARATVYGEEVVSHETAVNDYVASLPRPKLIG